MGDIQEAVNDAVEKARESKLNSAIAVLVAFSATFMALCNVKDGNVVQAMAQAQTKSVDAWAYYQAKSTKEHLADMMVESLTIQRETTSPSPEIAADLERRIAEYKGRVTKYEKEKSDIKTEAEGLQKEYDRLNVHDDQLDMAEASFSISIAMFGITALTQKRGLLIVACVFSSFGLLMGLAGFLSWNLHPDWLAKLLG